MTLTAGDQVQAGSATQTVVISGAGGEVAVADVAVTDITAISQGEHATVVPDGSHAALAGIVSSIAILPTTAANPTYAVTIALTGGATWPDGATATVSLQPASPNGTGTTVVVPTSAVTARGPRLHRPPRQPRQRVDRPGHHRRVRASLHPDHQRPHRGPAGRHRRPERATTDRHQRRTRLRRRRRWRAACRRWHRHWRPRNPVNDG